MKQKEEYNVIWIDDEWDTSGKSFIEICKKKHRILITPFKTRREGMETLERNLKFWDAVILDAKAFNNTSKEVADIDGLYAAIRQIESLKMKRYIPYFVLTRQPDLMDDRLFEKSVGKFYKKDAEGTNRLIADLKDEVGKSPRHQIKVLYADAMERLYSLDFEAGEDILDILEAIHHPELHPDFAPVHHYNNLRKILEWNYRDLNKYGIVPDECIEDGIVNLSHSCHYLSGLNVNHVNVRYGNVGESVVPEHIKDMMFIVLKLGNVKSHIAKLRKEDESNLERYLKNEVGNSKHLIFSLALQVCEITMWLGRYKDEHLNKEENIKKCIKLEIEEKNKKVEVLPEEELVGRVKSKKGCFYIGQRICLNPKTIQKNVWIGKKVKILSYIENTNDKTKEIFPYFAVKIQLLEDDPKNDSK